MIQDRWKDPAAVSEQRERFAETGSLRIESLLSTDIADELLASLRVEPHTLSTSNNLAIAFQYWHYPFVPELDCEHILCRFGRWLQEDGARWVGDIAGRDLSAMTDRQVVATHYGLGSFLDAHNDWDGVRRVAFVFGLTPESWEPSLGGHLEFLDPSDSSVLERRPPGWNTLDLFDVSEPTRPHQIPIVRQVAERRAISGWFR